MAPKTMAPKTKQPTLSKGILEMKFMKRTKVKVEKENEAYEGRDMYSKEITNRMLTNPNSNFIIEPSFLYCEGLLEGRLSFRGMNPEIERLVELEEQARNSHKQQEQPKDISDAEMAAFYHAQRAPAAFKSMKKKFNKKKEFGKINKQTQ